METAVENYIDSEQAGSRKDKRKQHLFPLKVLLFRPTFLSDKLPDVVRCLNSDSLCIPSGITQPVVHDIGLGDTAILMSDKEEGRSL